MRLHLDNYQTTLASPASIGATSVTVVDDPGALAAGEYFEATIVDNPAAPTKMDRVRVTANAAGTLTITPALVNGYDSGATLGAWNCKALFDLIDGAEIRRYHVTEATSVTAALDRANGEIQPLTLTADSALTLTMNDGESMIVPITWGAYSITSYPVDKWFTDVPTPGAAETVLTLVKSGGIVRAWATTEVV